ncbi:MAG TPA: RNA polymerase sigma factor SigM [Angustibacter sp.]|nr:RNA polymerase sigma factor SigM [Angustibacter sp.]
MTPRPGTAVASLADAELLAAHVQGDPDAFGELVRRHRDRLWAVALRTLGDREEAADALQDALVSAYRRADGFRGDAAVTTWLHRIVVNACLDRVRRRQARPTVALPEQEPADAVDAHDRTETALDVRAALARLPEHQRQALVLVDMHAMSVSEAAQVLDVAEGTIKSRCARGRAALAQLLRPGNLEPLPDVPPMTPERTAPAGGRPGAVDPEGGRA